MSAIGIFLALCALGIGFMVMFFVALCREGRVSRSSTLIRVGERAEPDVNAAESMVAAELSIHLLTNNGISKGARNPNAA